MCCFISEHLRLNKWFTLGSQLRHLRATCDELISLPFIQHFNKTPIPSESLYAVKYFISIEGHKEIYRNLKHYSAMVAMSMNPDSPEQIRDMGLQQWRHKGLSDFSHLFEDGQLMSFDRIKERYDIQVRYYLGYLIRDNSLRLHLTQ